MTEAVILSACRTAIGTARKGSLVDTSAYDLARAVIGESLRRTGVELDDYDDVIFGEALYGGGVVARHAALSEGLVNAPGLALNRHCASGLSAIQIAAANIRAGMDDLIIAGGVQSSSTEPTMQYRDPDTGEWTEGWRPATFISTPDAPSNDVSITVGWNTAVRAGISREDMDDWALRSHQRAIAAIDTDVFRDEIVPMTIKRADGSTEEFITDEHPRRNTTQKQLAGLKTLHPEISDFSITAGNSSGINDAAAAVVIASDSYARDHGIVPLARIISWATVALDPANTGLTPAPAIRKALERANLRVEDVDLFEINEAFASMCVAASRELKLDEDIVNVFGSGCSLGHPIAATGARMTVTLIHELRRRGGGIGIAAMCAAAGMGSALVIEVAAPRQHTPAELGLARF